MMSTKLVTLGLLKIKVLWNKGYDVKISVYGVTSKTLSRDSNYFVDVVVWLEIANPTIFMREVIITSTLYRFVKKNSFF